MHLCVDLSAFGMFSRAGVLFVNCLHTIQLNVTGLSCKYSQQPSTLFLKQDLSLKRWNSPIMAAL